MNYSKIVKKSRESIEKRGVVIQEDSFCLLSERDYPEALVCTWFARVQVAGESCCILVRDGTPHIGENPYLLVIDEDEVENLKRYLNK